MLEEVTGRTIFALSPGGKTIYVAVRLSGNTAQNGSKA
jgi:hypothetical protein